MKLLITGAGGQVGSELVSQALELGLEVVATSHRDLDIRNMASVDALMVSCKPDLVINAAAYTAVDLAEKEVDLAFAVNRDGAGNLAAACSRWGVPLFHMSTDYVYEGVPGRAYLESDRPVPQNVYGDSKWQGDQKVQGHDQHIILRVSWVFGRQGNNFVKTILRVAAQRDQLRIVDDQLGAPTWAGDIARELLELALRYRAQRELPWGVYHYCGKPVTTWFGFAGEILGLARNAGMIARLPELVAVATSEYPTAASRPLNSQLDCARIGRMLGVAPADWRVGLDNLIDHLGRR